MRAVADSLGESQAPKSMSDLARLGYRLYKKPPLKNVDCDCLLTINEHARVLYDLLEDIQPASASQPGATSNDWDRVRQWIQMAAGLEFVSVERLDDDSTLMCGTAADYQYAHNYLASLYATEETRLIYVWSAVERLLGIADIPSYKNIQKKHVYDRAAALLSETFSVERLPLHFLDVRAHLNAHIRNDPELRSDRRLKAASEIRPWRSDAGTLLTIGNAIRNFPAHGDVNVPEPGDWFDAGSKWLSALPCELHARRLATRGLLLSLQLLLAITCRYREDIEIDAFSGGRFIFQKGKGWAHRANPSLVEVLYSVHIRPPIQSGN